MINQPPSAGPEETTQHGSSRVVTEPTTTEPTAAHTVTPTEPATPQPQQEQQQCQPKRHLLHYGEQLSEPITSEPIEHPTTPRPN